MEETQRVLGILIVLTPAFQPSAGGVQRSTWKIAEYLAGAGCRVAVYSAASGGHVRPGFADLFHPDNDQDNGGSSPRSSLADTVAQFKPDVVINQMPYEKWIRETLAGGGGFARIACLRNTLFSVKLNIDGYASRTLPQAALPLFRTAVGKRLLSSFHRWRHSVDLREILRTHDKFVLFGPPNGEELSYFLKDYDRSCIGYIPNSVPSVDRSQSAKEKRLLWLGRVEQEQKRADLLLPLWQKLSQRLPDWHLDIVGTGSYTNQLKEEFENSGLSRFSIHGRQDPEDYYRRSPIFLMTSAWEGFPNTVIEAQSYSSVPVLFSSFPIAEWIVEDGVGGVLVPPFDVDAMVDAVTKLVRNDELSRMMVEAADNAERFHIGRVGPLWLELFESLLANRDSRL